MTLFKNYWVVLFLTVSLFIYPTISNAVLDEILYEPENPNTTDEINIFASFLAGPYVETQFHTINGNEIYVQFVQDGLDFGPNPPHFAWEKLEPLPAGSYSVTVEVVDPGFSSIIEKFELNVSSVPITSVPVNNPFFLLLMIVACTILSWIYFSKRNH